MSTALSLPAAEAAAENLTPSLHLVHAAVDVQSAEATRWMLWFGIPCLAAGLSVAAAIGSGISWFLAPAIASLGVAICALAWLAISSDTNA